ncbi:MAG: imidazole glycerol phosphate synthase subunit HisH [Methylotenera sp.]|nr:imidazole glycerol phosphate synthase subunit HisH [Methylotenera sp.]MDP1754105.1 imidazole glycerol phosphate synthase subunit HisH [Methylotenera sp.]MDP1959397.1 imidazole glycerol phosphate synthase subunit HisH [Methylotenera sp.]MDP3206607.1 imidazole glycerol phosphate synthase subunit HisH [Methylotenera sp.]MDP3302781.1 imidazole glycerol phosphate synthase subunit HisH [Methylotenera sp.]
MSKIDIAVVDYGMGNLRSVSKALEHVAPSKNVVVTSNPAEIIQAERVVFPGQGAMPDCMRELDARGLRDAVLYAAQHKPFLGICIGLQMLFEHSEEGDAAGLGLFKGNVKRFASPNMLDSQGDKLKVPHMGWNQVYQVNKTGSSSHALWHGIEDGARFYYVHSYYVEPQDKGVISGFSLYPKQFTCAIAKNNLFAVQFHPEKSADAGLQLLTNFVNWTPNSA